MEIPESKPSLIGQVGQKVGKLPLWLPPAAVCLAIGAYELHVAVSLPSEFSTDSGLLSRGPISAEDLEYYYRPLKWLYAAGGSIFSAIAIASLDPASKLLNRWTSRITGLGGSTISDLIS